ncbi:thiamine phosphate synthase [Dissulfurispira sp.]|uniref:thiamine phosphate synthase n=1 Tax=Dissulfurispira sp. TaxID=2817609 RepID=UPI002FD99993
MAIMAVTDINPQRPSPIRMNLKDRICFITDGSDEEAVLTILKSGIRWIQYRGKGKTKKEMFNKASRLREITKDFNACFIINDYADIALAVDADGVHLGQEDLPLKEARKILGNKIIGISTHNLQEAIDAEKGGADYIGFGSIFPTTTKDDAVVQGLDALRKVKGSVNIPVVAIGGINTDNVRSVFDAGCDGVAVSAGLSRGDMMENVRKFLCVIEEVGK